MSSYLRVLRFPDFRRLFLGQSASSLGDQVVIVTLALYITRHLHSASDLGYVFAAQSLPLIALVLFGGVWADRLPRHRIMIASDSARAILHAVLAALIFAGGASVGAMIVIEALFGAARAFFQPAYTGLLPQTIDEAFSQDAQALSATTANLAILIGPAIGTALVLTVGAGVAFALDAGSFVVSAMLLLGVHPRPRGEVEPVAGSVLADLRAGWREVRARPWVWATIAAFTVAVLTGYTTWYTLAPSIAGGVYGSTARFGVLESVAGAGALIGALVGVRWKPRHPLRVGLILSLIWAAQGVAFAAHVLFGVVIVICVGAGFGFAVFEIWWQTALIHHIPPRALSRVSSYDWMGSLALMPIGFALAGPTAGLLGPREVLGGGSVIAAVALLCALLPRSTRRLGSVAAEAQPSSARQQSA